MLIKPKSISKLLFAAASVEKTFLKLGCGCVGGGVGGGGVCVWVGGDWLVFFFF